MGLTLSRVRNIAIAAVCGAFAICAAAAIAAPTAAYAAVDADGYWCNGPENLSILKKSSAKLFYYPKYSGGYPYLFVDSLGRTPKSVKSSRTTVVSAKTSDIMLKTTCKKAGSSYVSFKVGSKSYRCKVTTVKYTQPLTYFKIGTKNFAGKYAKYDDTRTTSATIGGKKLTLKAASGWKVVKAYAQYTGGKIKRVYNGSKLPKSTWVVNVLVKHTKSGVVADLSLLAA